LCNSLHKSRDFHIIHGTMIAIPPAKVPSSFQITAGVRMQAIRKAVFPVAGLGTRFLPATKAMPKEMLPVVDKPLIQYAVEEAVAAGITDLIFVTGRNKRAIEDHFDNNPELVAELEAKKKDALLAVIRDILPENATCMFI